MRRAISGVHGLLAGLVVLAVVAQFLLAGAGIFGATSYQPHRIEGYLIALAALVLLALALLGRLGRARTGLSAVLVVLMVVQIALIESGQPWLEALHPVNALLILGASVQLARSGGVVGRGSRRLAGTVPADFETSMSERR